MRLTSTMQLVRNERQSLITNFSTAQDSDFDRSDLKWLIKDDELH